MKKRNSTGTPGTRCLRAFAAIAACVVLATASLSSAAPDVCGDVQNDDGIKASDALALLKAAVGVEQDLACPSSVAGVLSFDHVWSPLVLNGNSGNTVVTPQQCRTAQYTAGENEIAVIAVSATGSPSGADNDVLYIQPMVSKDGGNFMTVMVGDAAESFAEGTAHASSVFALPLEAGVVYVFGAGLSSNGMISVNTGTCQGTVQIVRPQL